MGDNKDSTGIVVDLPTDSGLRQVALTADDVIERSARAVDTAMEVIRQMSDRVRDTVDSLEQRPDTLEVEFGVVFDSTANAMVAKAKVEAAITVTIVWRTEEA